MIDESIIIWQSLGEGKISPPGSIQNPNLATTIATYKTQVAGRYRSVSPHDIQLAFPKGNYIVSPKIDGETWFLYTKSGKAYLLSPSGKIITGIAITEQAENELQCRDVLLAGELYGIGNGSRPRVHDLHAAMGGGKEAKIDSLRFAAFDILEESEKNIESLPFTSRAERLTNILGKGECCHTILFEHAFNSQDIIQAYEQIVTHAGHEGIIVYTPNGQTIKIKPEITIDAVVIGYTEQIYGGIAELLLALIRPDGRFQILGRVNTGFTKADRQDLAIMLRQKTFQSAFMAASRSGALFKFVKPEIVIEVKCNDILSHRANGDPIRRMALSYDQNNWETIRPLPFASLINAVFRRIREDKTVSPEAIRSSQVTDLVHVENTELQTLELPPSTVLQRQVFTKPTNGKTCVRKVVLWKTNKEKVDPLYPEYVIFFSDLSSGRKNPLKTDVRVASCLEKANIIAEAWIKKHTQGWKQYGNLNNYSSALPASCHGNQNFQLNLEIGFGRTSSINFQIAIRRMKALSKAGNIKNDTDDKGRTNYYSITFNQALLVEYIRRVENFYNLIFRWKSTEFVVNKDPLGFHEAQGVINAIDDIASCWRKHKRNDNSCQVNSLSCEHLRFEPKPGFPGLAREHPAWYAVGKFDGKVVIVDKDDLLHQINDNTNETLGLCPLFDRNRIIERITNLPDNLDPNEARWAMGYSIDANKPVWVFPKNIRYLPYGVTLTPGTDPFSKAINSVFPVAESKNQYFDMANKGAPSQVRNIPTARYSDVCGQDEAVEAVRDYAELPLKYPDLFQKVGVKPGRGILLWGPPGNGKTLLARAVAGESDAHMEIISGPSILSKWVGEAEQQLRDIFQRASQQAPSVILMDELDSITPIRDSIGSEHLQSIVSQLLVLMDGLSDRGKVLIIGTTNRPDMIDPAILRPGRIDRKVHVGLPNRNGQSVLLKKLFSKMPVADDIDIDKILDLTDCFSGAQLEHLINQAGLMAIKEAVPDKVNIDDIQVHQKHFIASILLVKDYRN